MFSVECVLLVVAMLTAPTNGVEDQNTDRIGLLISKMVTMEDNMRHLTDVVGDVKTQMNGFARTEEITNEKVFFFEF